MYQIKSEIKVDTHFFSSIFRVENQRQIVNVKNRIKPRSVCGGVVKVRSG